MPPCLSLKLRPIHTVSRAVTPSTCWRKLAFEVRLSPHGRKHTAAETAALLGDVDVLIAGTEPLTAEVLSKVCLG